MEVNTVSGILVFFIIIQSILNGLLFLKEGKEGKKGEKGETGLPGISEPSQVSELLSSDKRFLSGMVDIIATKDSTIGVLASDLANNNTFKTNMKQGIVENIAFKNDIISGVTGSIGEDKTVLNNLATTLSGNSTFKNNIQNNIQTSVLQNKTILCDDTKKVCATPDQRDLQVKGKLIVNGGANLVINNGGGESCNEAGSWSTQNKFDIVFGILRNNFVVHYRDRDNKVRGFAIKGELVNEAGNNCIAGEGSFTPIDKWW